MVSARMVHASINPVVIKYCKFPSFMLILINATCFSRRLSQCNNLRVSHLLNQAVVAQTMTSRHPRIEIHSGVMQDVSAHQMEQQ